METCLLETGLEAVISGVRGIGTATNATLRNLGSQMEAIADSAGGAGYQEVAETARQAAATLGGLRDADAQERWTGVEAVGRVGQWILATLCREATASTGTNQDTRRILIIDDSRASSGALCQGFRSASLAARNVSSLDEVLTELVLFRPDIVVSDVFMPDVDVTVVGRAFRSLSRQPRSLLVLISGSEGDELRAKLKETKPDLFLPKRLGVAEVVAQTIAEWNAPAALGWGVAAGPSSDDDRL